MSANRGPVEGLTHRRSGNRSRRGRPHRSRAMSAGDSQARRSKRRLTVGNWVNAGIRCLALVGLVVAAGCGGKSGQAQSEEPLKVNVSTPVVRSITNYEVFSGRTEAVESTDVRARVSGYLEK